MTEVILAATQPLPGEGINAAAEVARTLAEEGFHADRLTVQMLPADMKRAGTILVDRIKSLGARAVLIAGQNHETDAVRVEARARNHRDFSGIQDAGRNCPKGEPIAEGAPKNLPVTMAAKALLKHLKSAGAKVSDSNDPGAHLMNHILFEVLLQVSQDPDAFGALQVGAVSLPILPGQGARWGSKSKGMEAADQLMAVRSAVEFALAAG